MGRGQRADRRLRAGQPCARSHGHRRRRRWTTATRRVVQAFANGPHIFNLGHGITPDADPDNVHTDDRHGAWGLTRAPAVRPKPIRTPSRPILGGVVHPTPKGVGASGVVEQHSVGITAVLADGIIPEKVRSLLQHTVDAVLAPLSVLALAALASPGVAGLLLLSAAGMFVGYRQARAASMLRAVGIARFAKSGPLGVVRSGGLVAVHARPSRALRRQPPRSQVFSSLSPDQAGGLQTKHLCRRD